MLAKTFVLIETEVGKTKEVVSILKKIEGLKSVDTVTGPYDIIIAIEGPDINAIGNLVTKHIQSVSGVARTVTCLTIKLE